MAATANFHAALAEVARADCAIIAVEAGQRLAAALAAPTSNFSVHVNQDVDPYMAINQDVGRYTIMSWGVTGSFYRGVDYPEWKTGQAQTL